VRTFSECVKTLIGASLGGCHMSRLFPLLMFFFAFVGCAPEAAPLAPVPAGAEKSSYYFPTRVGTKWVYETTGGDDYTETVTAVEEKDRRYAVTVATTSHDDPEGLEPGIEKYLVSKDGVFRIGRALESATDKQEFDPPVCLLKLPHTLGDKWGGGPRTNTWERVAGKVETVKVPAGTFEAVRVDLEIPRGELGEGHYAQWYAPGVGKVKLKANDIVIQMKSFTLPKG
jgi:hypothetical protein